MGLIAGLPSARLFAGMLVGVKAHDPMSFALAWTWPWMSRAAVLGGIFPALKSAGTDLISALHSE